MFDSYKLRMNALGSYGGEAKRRNSQKIMDAAWLRDAATKPVYVKWVDSGLPSVGEDDEVLYAKYNVKSYHSIQGDEIAYLLQFRLDDMKNRADIKVGSYVHIPNDMGEYEWWLIWHLDDRNQFRQYSIVKCTYVYRWVSFKDGGRVVHECLGCSRNQSSYNSGVWLDYTTQVVENQHILVMPTNDDSRTITYDTKFLISEPGRYPPLAWKISKVAPGLNGDITKFTMTQEMFDSVRDDAELLIANYHTSAVPPTMAAKAQAQTISNLEITYSGHPAVRAGGGYKTFTLVSQADGESKPITDGVTWSVEFPDGDVAQIKQEYTDDGAFKIKCLNDYSLIGKTFTIIAQTDEESKSLTLEVIGL